MSSKSRKISEKDRKDLRVRRVLTVCLALVALLSVYKLAEGLMGYKEAGDVYDELRNAFVQELDDAGEPSGAVADETEDLPGKNTDPAATGETAASREPARTEPEKSTAAGGTKEKADPTAEGDVGDGDETPAPPDGPESKTPGNETAGTVRPRESAPTAGMKRLSINFDSLLAQAPDAKGWLQGHGGQMSLPVVQGQDNDFYIDHLYNGQYNGSGTLFVDYRNNFLQDTITYIYGHHMKNGTMFGMLENYEDLSYMRANPSFNLYTPSGSQTLEVWAAAYVNSKNMDFVLNFRSEEQFDAYMNKLKSMACACTGAPVSSDERFVILYTCAYLSNKDRMIVVCKVK